MLVAAAVTAAAWQLVPAGAVAIPARDGASSVLWPLVPTLVTLAMPPVLATADRDLERTAARSPVRLRAVALGVCLAAVAAAVLPGCRFDLMVAARNAALLTGLAAGGSALYPAVAWVPVTVTPMAMWLLGTDPLTRRLAGWAVLLEPRTSVPALVVGCGAALAGSAAYLARGWGTGGRLPAVARPVRRGSRAPEESSLVDGDSEGSRRRR
jgi:hypothetical protein